MMTNGPFATQDQVLEYFNRNSEYIDIGENINFGNLLVLNYYIFDEDNEQPYIGVVKSKNEFYISLTSILAKKPGEDVFTKKTPSTNNIYLIPFQRKISSGVLRIKHIATDSRITIDIRPAQPAQPVQVQQNMSSRPNIPNTHLPIGGGYNNSRLTVPFESGHMVDYIRHQEAQLEARQQYQPSSSTITAPAVEEIQDETSYKDNVTCKICLSNKINIVCIPCGHCFCSACNTQSRNNLCAVCRTPITKTQPLFI
jgi:hypothetical protein